MMKKWLIVLTAALLAVSLAACGNTVVSTQTTETSAATEKAAEAAASKIDVDLSAMSGTMVYSEVLNMQQTPEKYLGKTVRMKGAFSVAESGGNRYFACIIKDATACCAQGIEFDWAGDHSYPDDYPKENDEITVTGKFTTYMEGKSRYLQLADAELTF